MSSGCSNVEVEFMLAIGTLGESVRYMICDFTVPFATSLPSRASMLSIEAVAEAFRIWDIPGDAGLCPAVAVWLIWAVTLSSRCSILNGCFFILSSPAVEYASSIAEDLGYLVEFQVGV